MGSLALALFVACSGERPDTVANPVGPSQPTPTPAPPPPTPPPPPPEPPAVVVHDTMNAPGGASNTEFFQTMRPGGGDRQYYDDFISQTAATIRTVTWQGGYAPSTPAATSFYVAFIADDGSGFPRLEPDAGNTGRARALYSATFPVGQTNERLDAVVPCTNDNRQCGLYTYSVTLATPFAAAAGVRYWFCVQADVPASSDVSWGWRRGTPDNQRSRSNIAGVTHSWDLAFSLR